MTHHEIVQNKSQVILEIQKPNFDDSPRHADTSSNRVLHSGSLSNHKEMDFANFEDDKEHKPKLEESPEHEDERETIELLKKKKQPKLLSQIFAKRQHA